MQTRQARPFIGSLDVSPFVRVSGWGMSHRQAHWPLKNRLLWQPRHVITTSTLLRHALPQVPTLAVRVEPPDRPPDERNRGEERSVEATPLRLEDRALDHRDPTKELLWSCDSSLLFQQGTMDKAGRTGNLMDPHDVRAYRRLSSGSCAISRPENLRPDKSAPKSAPSALCLVFPRGTSTVPSPPAMRHGQHRCNRGTRRLPVTLMIECRFNSAPFCVAQRHKHEARIKMDYSMVRTERETIVELPLNQNNDTWCR